MNIVDRQAIEDLFTRLQDAEKKGGPRDPEAEELIAKLVSRQPAAAYYLAQTVLVQQWALNNAHDRIENLERRAEGGGGFLSALFGGGGARSGGHRSSAPKRESAINPALGQTATTGFLATASNTALGVAGGFILADMLQQGNFTDSSLATGFAPDTPPAADAGGGAGSDAGGDFGGDYGGGMDFGGGDGGF